MTEPALSVRVFKFGGTSVQDAQAILKVAEIVRPAYASGPLVVVLSAMGGVTDLLLGAANAAIEGKSFAQPIAVLRERHHKAAESLIRDASRRGEILRYVDASCDELETICQSLA